MNTMTGLFYCVNRLTLELVEVSTTLHFSYIITTMNHQNKAKDSAANVMKEKAHKCKGRLRAKRPSFRYFS